MKRGFLNTSKAKKQVDQPVLAQPDKNKTELTKLSHGVVPEAGFLPKGYQSPKIMIVETNPKNLDHSPDSYIFTTVPPMATGVNLVDAPGGWTECCISGHVKRVIYETPGFPRVPLSPPNGKSYRIGKADGKGLGMFATRPIRAGDLILDERPLLVCPNGLTIGSLLSLDILDTTALSDEQQRQIILHEWGKHIKIACDRMLPGNRKAFMELFNSHEHDGTGEIIGRIRTNGIQCNLKERPGAPLAYAAIYKDISRINHCCGPNAMWKWHINSFSLRIYATRDVGVGEEVTCAYCDTMAAAAERAASLAPYGIIPCKCSPSCSDEAKSKIADERRARFRSTPIVLKPPVAPPKAGKAKDGWAQPAIKLLQEMEEEGLEGTVPYAQTALQLFQVYSFLQDIEKALFYGYKMENMVKIENGEMPTAEVVKANNHYKSGGRWQTGLRVNVSFT
ncbi:hypothetical protein GYMLUDRAFT_202001 [Collybiopsis luxurians FD-317 M1]|uniref:SET domain-containing protein n=1 Tax=Collybiopsis luxurians FD-317 M1 TaxID=944289 RepID=A0A0D0B6L3_9AGAR|nr:hypothetical protein GYMLUDRAFT_202001 [Collybiopsis luxurians FD-317 M1]